jgi:hypothetical protein
MVLDNFLPTILKNKDLKPPKNPLVTEIIRYNSTKLLKAYDDSNDDNNKDNNIHQTLQKYNHNSI